MKAGRGILLTVLFGVSGLAVWMCLPDADPPIEDPYRRGLQALHAGDLVTYRQCVELLDGPEFEHHLRVLEAVRSLLSGYSNEALALLAVVPQDGPLRREILFYSGRALKEQSRLAEAEMQLLALATEFPDDPEAHRWLGIVYFDLGAFDAAVAHLNRLAELSPDEFQPHLLLEIIYADFDNDSMAVEHQRLALERDPPPEVARQLYADLGASLMRLRDYGGALEALEGAETTVETLVVEARCHWNSNRSDEAMACLEQALHDDPQHRDGLLLKAEIMEAEGDIDGAIALLRGVVSVSPYDTDSHYQLALMLGRNGQEAESAQIMARWEELNALNTRLVELNRQANSDVRNAELRDEIAEVCDAIGRHELAESWREAAEACRQRDRLISEVEASSDGETDSPDDESASSGGEVPQGEAPLDENAP